MLALGGSIMTDSLYYHSSAESAEPTRYASLTRPSFFRGSGAQDYVCENRGYGNMFIGSCENNPTIIVVFPLRAY